MAPADSPIHTQVIVATRFRREPPDTPCSPISPDDAMKVTDRLASQYAISALEHSVHSIGEKDAEDPNNSVDQRARLIIAVDFGTTYSSVSYARVEPGVNSTALRMNQIHCINNFESSDGRVESRASARNDNVPTKLLYLGTKQRRGDQTDKDSDRESQHDSVSDVDIQPISTPEGSVRSRRKRGRKFQVPSSTRITRRTWSRPEGVTVRWGYSVPAAQKEPCELEPYPEKEAVELIKLTLGQDEDGDKALRTKRAKLTEQIERLRSRRIVVDRDHILCDYLVRLLRHAKVVLEKRGFLEAAQLEYVLCVPVTWSESACRTMHDAMVRTIQACRLSTLTQHLIPELFIVSEPEAAAQYVIASLGSEGRLRQGEVFILLDAGGGTVDITTYRVTSDEMGPLRMQSEVIKPEGALCGSSLITEGYLSKIREKLGKIFPGEKPDRLDAVATGLAIQWDFGNKPRINVDDHGPNLSEMGGKQYYKDKRVRLEDWEIREIFEPSLKGTTNLLENQLRSAKEKNLVINKLIVVGGFGESPSLRSRIRQVLSTWDDGGEEIYIIWPDDLPTSAVVQGAVLRALDKRNGPDRVSRSSFGFLRHERYGAFPEHSEANVVPTRDGVDHDKFVRDTIYWLIDAGEELPSRYQTHPILSCHTFAATDVKLICIEKLYVSQYKHRSHFQCHHDENKGATLLSYIEVDVSDLRKEFPLEEKADVGPRTKVSNRSIRVVKFDLVIEVEGKQLKYEARWPPNAITPEDVRVRKSGYVSLAPSFVPGTE